MISIAIYITSISLRYHDVLAISYKLVFHSRLWADVKIVMWFWTSRRLSFKSPLNSVKDLDYELLANNYKSSPQSNSKRKRLFDSWLKLVLAWPWLLFLLFFDKDGKKQNYCLILIPTLFLRIHYSRFCLSVYLSAYSIHELRLLPNDSFESYIYTTYFNISKCRYIKSF